jgi:hypothetical protein
VAIEGSAELTLTVRGTQFAPGAFVRFDRVPLATTVVSAEELRAIVPERLLRAVGTVPISVSNPWPDSGDTLESGTVPFIVKFRTGGR